MRRRAFLYGSVAVLAGPLAVGEKAEAEMRELA